MKRSILASFLILSSLACNCAKNESVVATSSSATSSSPPPSLPSPSGRDINRDDLLRWTDPSGQVGMDCLDEKIRNALRSTAQGQSFKRNEVYFNPSPVQLETNPQALAIYVVEAEKEAGRLQWLRGGAYTADVSLSRTLVPIIVVDKNLLRWMGNRLERLIIAARTALDSARQELSRPGLPSTQWIADSGAELASRANGGFGTPIRSFTPAPDALARYCAKNPSGEDVLALGLAFDTVLWTFRHEMHHIWYPKTSALTNSCPSKQEVEKAALPEVEADAFAVSQMKKEEIDAFIAPWKEQVDAWVSKYSGPSFFEPSTRITSIAYVLGHHEVSTIVNKQAWISEGRSQALSRLGNAGAPEDSFPLIRALAVAKDCPSTSMIEQQCAVCPANQVACEKAIDMAWKCAPFLVVDENAVPEQVRMRELAFAHLRKRGFHVTKRPESNVHLDGYVIEREGNASVSAASLRGIPFPQETEEFSEIRRRDNFYHRGGARHISGLMLILDKNSASSALSSEPVIEALLEFETNMFRDGCDKGDARACRWLGFSYRTARGTKADEVAAYRAYDKACKGGFKDGCVQKENWLQFLKSACDEQKILCAQWRNVKTEASRYEQD